MIIGPTLDCYWNVLQSDGGDTWTYFHICSYMFNSLSWNKSCGCHVSSGATDDPMEIGGMPTDAPKKMSTGSKTDWVMWSMWSMARGKDGKGFGHQLIGSLFSAETAFFQRLASLVLDVLYSIPFLAAFPQGNPWYSSPGGVQSFIWWYLRDKFACNGNIMQYHAIPIRCSMILWWTWFYSRTATEIL